MHCEKKSRSSPFQSPFHCNCSSFRTREMRTTSRVTPFAFFFFKKKNKKTKKNKKNKKKPETKENHKRLSAPFLLPKGEEERVGDAGMPPNS